MKWKLYFIVLSILAIFSFVGILTIPQDRQILLYFHFAIFLGELFGLYSFIYHKTNVSKNIWKNFLYLNIVLDSLFLLYVLFPQTLWLQWYAMVSSNAENSVREVVLSLLADIPLLYVLYKLSKGEFAIQTKLKVQFIKPHIPRWSIFQIALWGYSFVLNGILLISLFFHQENTYENELNQTDFFINSLTLAPLVLFWIVILFQMRFYKKSWWRLTLVANALLFSLLIFASIFMRSVANTNPAQFDFIAFLQVLIVLAGLTIFGREQFSFELNIKESENR